MRKRLRTCALVLAPLLVTAAVGPSRLPTWHPNLHVQLADAFLAGRLHLTHKADDILEGRQGIEDHMLDASPYKGRVYVAFPPAPAIVLLPVVAIFGLKTNVVLVAMVLTVLNVILLSRILEKLRVDEGTILWLLLAFFMGTAYWLSLLDSNWVWYFSHVVAVSGMLLAIHEALGKARGVLLGLFLAVAFLSRQLCVYAFFFLAAALWVSDAHETRRAKLAQLAAFAGVLACSVALYMLYNYVRFGSPLDSGYSYMWLRGFLRERVERFGLFNPVYVPFNFIYMFLQGFHVRFSEPTFIAGVKWDRCGTSLTFASPFVFLALGARWDRKLLWGAWASVLLMLGQMLFYYNNGWTQVNAQRFTLDFLPILMLLVALGVQRVHPKVWKTAVAYAVALNVVALYGVPCLRATERALFARSHAPCPPIVASHAAGEYAAAASGSLHAHHRPERRGAVASRPQSPSLNGPQGQISPTGLERVASRAASRLPARHLHRGHPRVVALLEGIPRQDFELKVGSWRLHLYGQGPHPMRRPPPTGRLRAAAASTP